MENNNYTVEDRLIKYNNSVLRNNIKVGFANLKIKNAGKLHNLKNKILTPFCGKEAGETKTAKDRYATYQENYLNKLAGRKGVARITYNITQNADSVTESILLMQNEIPYLITKTTTKFDDPERPNFYSEKTVCTYRGLKTTKSKRFEYFDIATCDYTLIYFDNQVSPLANFKVYKDINSTKLILGKKHFRATYDNHLSTNTIFFMPDSNSCHNAYKSENCSGGKIENARQSLNEHFNKNLVKPEDVSIISMLESEIAKELNRGQDNSVKQNNLSSVLDLEK